MGIWTIIAKHKDGSNPLGTDHPHSMSNLIASVAQLVEHVPEEHGVGGSIPSRGTKV
jgi:hypothetical protein